MREILFRGKRLDTDEWVYGVPLFEEIRCYMIEDLFICDEYQCTEAVYSIVDLETIGQYTGLTDKNGNKIFEGDLCLCNRNINDRFDKTVFAIKYDELIGFYGENEWGGNTISADEFGMCEIFGNVFDNPELLEVNKNDKL